MSVQAEHQAQLIPPPGNQYTSGGTLVVKRTGEATMLTAPGFKSYLPAMALLASIALGLYGLVVYFGLRQNQYPPAAVLVIGAIPIFFALLGVVGGPAIMASRLKAKGPAVVVDPSGIHFPRAGWSGTRQEIDRLDLVYGEMRTDPRFKSSSSLVVSQLQLTPVGHPAGEPPLMVWQGDVMRRRVFAERVSRVTDVPVEVHEAPRIEIDGFVTGI